MSFESASTDDSPLPQTASAEMAAPPQAPPVTREHPGRKPPAGIGVSLLLIVLLVAGLRFIDLGREDLGKDEALWCVRAKAVAFHEDWIDTTPHAVGKLMVSSYPPLHAWLTGLLYKGFGASAFTSRLVSAAAGAATVLLIYLMGSMAFGRLAGFFAAMMLGLNVLFFEYSRLGQLEALYLFTIVAALWLYMVHVRQGARGQGDKGTKGTARSEGAKGQGDKGAATAARSPVCPFISVPLVLSGVAFGLALMSKIATGLFVPIILVPYLVYLVYNRRRSVRRAIADLVLIGVIGLIIAAPWHLYMMGKYSPDNAYEGKTFVDWFWWHHIVKRSNEPLEGLHHSGYGWGHLFYLNSILVNMPFIAVAAFYGIAVAIGASLPGRRRLSADESSRRSSLTLSSPGGRGDEEAFRDRITPTFRMLFLLWAILTFFVLERSATRMSSYVITLVPPMALFAGWTLGQLVEGRIGARGRTVLLGFTLLVVAYMADQRAQDSLETVLGRIFNLPVENPMSPAWLLMIPAYLVIATLLAGLYHVFLSRKPRFERVATVVLVVFIVAGAAGKGAFGKLMRGPRETTWESLSADIPAKTDYDMVLAIGHWRDDRQIQYYLDGVGCHWEPRMFLELREVPDDWETHRDEVWRREPVTFDGRWRVDAEPPLFRRSAWEHNDTPLENLTDRAVVDILTSDDSVENKLRRLLRARRVLVLLVEDSDLGRQYRPLIARLAWPVARTQKLSLFLSGDDASSPPPPGEGQGEGEAERTSEP